MAGAEPGSVRAPRMRVSELYDPENPPPLAAPVSLGFAQAYSIGRLAALQRVAKASEGAVTIVHDAAELRRCLETGSLAMILHFEDASAIDPGFNALEVFWAAGLRSLGLCWSRPNAFATGVPFRYGSSPDIGPGLTDLGKELVRECNRMRIMVDLSHLNERGFWDVVEISDAPLVASHSNAFAVCPFTRNLTDKQLDAIRDSGGIVGVNFGAMFLRPDGKPEVDTPIEVVVSHFAHLVERMGIDHVGFGSDFDGTRVVSSIGDAAGLVHVVDGLRAHGFTEPELQKLGHENWERVLAQTW
jgi:membrane dipeptidase